MNNTNAYCRLCANLKPNDNLTDLQNLESAREEIESRLKRLNCNLDFTESSLPKTVCRTCINTLNRVYAFILSVDSAQVVLNEKFLLPNIKKENIDSDLFEEEEVKINAPIKTEPAEIDSITVKTENTTAIEVKVEYDNDLLKEDGAKTIKVKVEYDSDIPEEEDVTNTNNVTTEVNTYLTWQDYSWKCRSCETQFPTLTELINHSMTYHKVCNAFSCIDCNTKRGSLKKFLIHVYSHHNNLRLSCHICYKTYKHETDLYKHRLTHKTTDFRCRGCHAYFQSSDELTKHTNTFLRMIKSFLPFELKQKGYICKFCKKVFKTQALLVSHLVSHKDKRPVHTCDRCGKCYLTKTSLSAHMKLHDDPEKPQFQCKICKYTFRTKLYLQKHLKSHKNIKLPCTECDKSFSSIGSLREHQEVMHTDSTPHVCSYCSKKFKYKSGLNLHLHQHTGDKPYTCDICKRDFKNGPNYNKHMKQTHNRLCKTDIQIKVEKEGHSQ